MRLRALLDTDALGLRLLGGEEELDRTVRGVMTTDLKDPSRYLTGGELVLTGLAWRREPADSERFVRILTAAGVAGLAAGEAELGSVPDDLVLACARHRLPLFAVDEDVSFASITEHVVRQVSTERAGDLAAVVERHRRLMASGPAGGGPDAVLDLLGSDLDLRAWVLSTTGRRIAGSDHPLPAQVRAELAGEHLAASRTGRPSPHRAYAAGRPYSLFPIRSGDPAADVRATLLSDWFLAVDADAGEWPAERLDLLHGVTQLIAVERERRDASRTVRRRLAAEVMDLVQAGAPPSEIAARLRVAAPVLAPGLGAAPHWQVVVARVDWAGGGVPSGPAAQALLEEALVDPAAVGSDPADRIAVAHAGDEALALVPLSSVDTDGPAPELSAQRLLGMLRAPLTHGLDGDGRLTIGVSAAVHSADGLRGALEEARHARRVAAARPGRVCVAGHEELASHVLLLPFVPDDVRRAFTARLLDPLRDYDQRHRADLIPTLGAFLECDGSWTRCANRLHLHVNTLRYRIGRIEQLTGRDLSRLEDKVDFFLALRMS
ncbi:MULTISPECIES: PucR family transcriptional regulator [unclassified Streptomyces]|uniref:PucR family transcriptional regulator n=1 Tax=unclassified Streptomyces TaxID=2593676 RepID=UPI0037FBC936